MVKLELVERRLTSFFRIIDYAKYDFRSWIKALVLAIRLACAALGIKDREHINSLESV